MVLEKITSRDSLPEELFGKGGALYEAQIKVHSKNSTSYTAMPKLAIAKGNALPVTDTVVSESLIIKLNKVNGNKVELGIKETDSIMEYVTLKAYKFPFSTDIVAGCYRNGLQDSLSVLYAVMS